jgi:hypothetical protein
MKKVNDYEPLLESKDNVVKEEMNEEDESGPNAVLEDEDDDGTLLPSSSHYLKNAAISYAKSDTSGDIAESSYVIKAL